MSVEDESVDDEYITQFYINTFKTCIKLAKNGITQVIHKVTVGIRDLFRVSGKRKRNTTQFTMEVEGGFESGWKALRRWNFCALPCCFRRLKDRRIWTWSKEVYWLFDLRKVNSPLRKCGSINYRELRESEHLASISISARKKIG